MLFGVAQQVYTPGASNSCSFKCKPTLRVSCVLLRGTCVHSFLRSCGLGLCVWERCVRVASKRVEHNGAAVAWVLQGAIGGVDSGFWFIFHQLAA